MQFSVTSFLFTLYFALFSMMSLTTAVPVGLENRDVYSPPVLYPHAGTVWKVGSTHNVTWDTSNPPKQITDKIGEIYLMQGHTVFVKTPLANGFNILDGRAEIKVPHVSAGSNYRLILMGDSSNWSGQFKIEN